MVKYALKIFGKNLQLMLDISNIKKIKKVVDIFFPLLYTNSCVTERTQTNPSGCGSAWLEHLVWDQGVAGSNPVTPTCNLDFVFIFQKISTKLLTNDVG